MMLSAISGTDKLDQGAIVHGIAHPVFHKLENAVVMNPTCLFANGKVDNVILAYLLPVNFVLRKNKDWLDLIEQLTEKVKAGTEDVSKKKSKTVESIIGKLVDSDEPRRYFFLKGVDSIHFPDTFIDFQQITAVPFSKVESESKMVEKINSPWREKVATHYAGYMMRVGVDRYEGEEREKIISNIAQPLSIT